MLEQVIFFIRLHEEIKDAVMVRAQVMPDNLWRQIHIGYDGDAAYSSFILIPKSPVSFNHSFTVSAIKINPELYNHINKLNTAISVMCTSIDSCIGFAIANDTDGVKKIADMIVNGNIENNSNIARNAVNSICVFSKELSVFNGFPKASKKIKSAIGIDLEK